MQERNILKRFSINLRKIRIKNNYTQQYVSEKINIDRSVYARWESGNNCPDIKLSSLVKLLKFFKISLDDLLK